MPIPPRRQDTGVPEGREAPGLPVNKGRGFHNPAAAPAKRACADEVLPGQRQPRGWERPGLAGCPLEGPGGVSLGEAACLGARGKDGPARPARGWVSSSRGVEGLPEVAHGTCSAQAQIMFALLIGFHPKDNVGAFSRPHGGAGSTRSVPNAGHLLLIVSSGQGHDYPRFTEEETGAQTCPRCTTAKKQVTGRPSPAPPPGPFEFLLRSPGLPRPPGRAARPLGQALVGLAFA